MAAIQLFRAGYSWKSDWQARPAPPQALIRVGLNPKLEARIILPDYLWPSRGKSGFGDGGVGVRYKFYQSKDGNTKLSLAPILSIPVRSA